MQPDIAVATVARAVLCAAAVSAGGAAFGCAPPAPADPTSTREGAADDPDAEVEAADAKAASAAPEQDQLVWLSSEKEAVAQGQAERRPVLMHFEVNWCADCKRMKQETLGDPRVKAQAGRFVAVRIDATDDEDPQVSAALQKYTVINVPTLILLDSKGHEQHRFTELVGPETLLHEIELVR